MFNTNLEICRNGYILQVTYGRLQQRWVFLTLPAAEDTRQRFETLYWEGCLDSLKEELV